MQAVNRWTVIALVAGTGLLSACDNTKSPQSAQQKDDTMPNTMTNIMPNKNTDADTDPLLWLEEVEGEAALSWVRQQNERSLAFLQKQDTYAANSAQALDIATSQERIPYGVIRDDKVYNFWQDEIHVRGLWRRTAIASYASLQPEWETVIDFDALAESESKNWVFKGSNCLTRKGAKTTRCMIALSDGGKDAVVNREFDLISKGFVEDGFVTSEAKQDIAWIDANTLLVGTDWGNDGATLTDSGYPASVRLWQRGQALAQARQLYAGQRTSVGSFPWSRELDSGEVIYGVTEAQTFFTNSVWLLAETGAALLMPVPAKSSLGDIFAGYQFVTLQEDWHIDGQSQAFKLGDLVAFNIDQLRQDRTLPPVELVFRPTEQQAVNGVAVAKSAALLAINDNVASRLLRLERDASGWRTSPVELPGTGQASIYFAAKEQDRVFINFEGFLTPGSLLSYDTGTRQVAHLKSLPAKFNADGLVVQQHAAVAKDGTRIPFFVVHRQGLEFDGSTPTLLYGYGGFEVSMTPAYSAGIGRLWLEKGGAYVLANIRGGGEFGPAWHQAGLKVNRQRVYDDFIAVGEALLSMHLTSPRHLGIMGGSNGGLLMGVMLNQRPDLWRAVVVQVPLLDMLRYHKLLAGASWVAEYGNPDVAEERAFLKTISPYHNFDATVDYPMPFFVTSTKDDRVHPGHARKMARLFETAGKPFLYYENIDGGHSAAANQQEWAKRTALEYTYLIERLFPKSGH